MDRHGAGSVGSTVFLHQGNLRETDLSVWRGCDHTADTVHGVCPASFHCCGDDLCWLIFGSALAYAICLIGSGELIPRIGSMRFMALAMIISCLAVMTQFIISRDMAILNQPVHSILLR